MLEIGQRLRLPNGTDGIVKSIHAGYAEIKEVSLDFDYCCVVPVKQATRWING